MLVVQGLNCSAVCGIFLDQGSNPCLPVLPGGFFPLSHQESPEFGILLDIVKKVGVTPPGANDNFSGPQFASLSMGTVNSASWL